MGKVNPANQKGNHFVAVKFSRSLSSSSVLDSSANGLANQGLTGAITVVAYDQKTGQSSAIEGRGFINGQTFFGTGGKLETWVRKRGVNQVAARTVSRNNSDIKPGVGFPGTDDLASGIADGSFSGAGALISPNTFVFVVDTDDNLATYESFPVDRVIRIVIKGAEDGASPASILGGVRSKDGRYLEQGGVATSHVGVDFDSPDLLLDGLSGTAVTLPRDLAMAPDLNLLAVSNNGPNTVSFIDTNPNSPTFHTLLKTTSLVDEVNSRNGLGPTEVVWQPGGEDILVLCERSDSLAILSGAGLEVRKIIPGVENPKFLAVTDRATQFGFQSGLYYAYVVSESGTMNIFESGPDGIQGIGFDDFVGLPNLDGRSGFSNPSAIMMDPGSNQHAVFVAYSDTGSSIVDSIWLENAPTGPVSLRTPPGQVVDPNRRDKEWKLQKQYASVFSSAAILDLAVDDLTNIGDATQLLGATVGGSVSHSGKGLHRGVNPVSAPQFLFAASANGLVDVIDLATGQPALPRPIRVPGVSVLAHYWRQ